MICELGMEMEELTINQMLDSADLQGESLESVCDCNFCLFLGLW